MRLGRQPYGEAVKHAAVAALLLSFLLGACTVSRGSGNVITETRTVEAFEAISVSNAIDVRIEVGRDHSVVLEGDDNLVEIVRTRVDGSTLRIDNQPGRSFVFGSVTARLTMPALTGIDVSGSSSVRADGIDGGTIDLDVSGSGSIDLSGTASNLEADIYGSGSIDGAALAVDNADISVSGSGSVIVAVDNALRAGISGSGSIEYIGNPSIQSEVSGSGSVSQRS